MAVFANRVKKAILQRVKHDASSSDDEDIQSVQAFQTKRSKPGRNTGKVVQSSKALHSFQKKDRTEAARPGKHINSKKRAAWKDDITPDVWSPDLVAQLLADSQPADVINIPSNSEDEADTELDSSTVQGKEHGGPDWSLDSKPDSSVAEETDLGPDFFFDVAPDASMVRRWFDDEDANVETLPAKKSTLNRCAGSVSKKSASRTCEAKMYVQNSQHEDIVSVTEDVIQKERGEIEDESKEDLPVCILPWEHATDSLREARRKKRRLAEIARELGEDIPQEVVMEVTETFDVDSSLLPPVLEQIPSEGSGILKFKFMKDGEVRKETQIGQQSVGPGAQAVSSFAMPQDDDDDWGLSQMRLALGGRTPLRNGMLAVNDAQGTQKTDGAASTPIAPAKKMMSPVDAMAQFKHIYERLASGFQDRKERLVKLDEQHEEASLAIERLSEEEKRLKQSRNALRDVEGHVFCLAGLLDKKKDRLEMAMDTLAQLERNFAAQRLHRRRRDIHSEVQLVGAKLKTALSESETENVPNKRSKQKLHKRRMKRQRHRDSVRPNIDPGGGNSQMETWDTSDSSDDREELAIDRAAFCDAAWKQIFADVNDEFLEVEGIIKYFERMKMELGEEYLKAHVSLSLTEVVALHIGFSLLWWDPLGMLSCRGIPGKSQMWGPKAPEFGATLGNFPWFERLADFSELLGSADPDVDLVPSVVRSCVFPEVKRRLLNCWDVSSRVQSLAVVALLDECLLFESAESSASNYAELLNAAHQRLEECISALVPQAIMGDNHWWSSSTRMRHLWRACKIAANALMLDKYLPDETLAELVLNSIVAQRVLPAIKAPRVDHGELEVIEHIVGLLPSRWLQNGLPSDLGPLRDALVAPPTGDVAATTQRASKILRQLQCFDEALVLLQLSSMQSCQSSEPRAD